MLFRSGERPVSPAACARCSGIRCDRWRNRPFRPDGPTAGTEDSSWAHTGGSRPSPRGARIGRRPHSDGSRIAAVDLVTRRTGSTSIPRHCRPCRTGRSRWPETHRPVRSPRSRPRPNSRAGNFPARYWPETAPRDWRHRPMDRPCLRGRRGLQILTRPRSATPCRTTPHRRARPHRRRARRDDRRGRRSNYRALPDAASPPPAGTPTRRGCCAG